MGLFIAMGEYPIIDELGLSFGFICHEHVIKVPFGGSKNYAALRSEIPVGYM